MYLKLSAVPVSGGNDLLKIKNSTEAQRRAVLTKKGLLRASVVNKNWVSEKLFFPRYNSLKIPQLTGTAPNN